MDVFERFRVPGGTGGLQRKARDFEQSGSAHLMNDDPRRAVDDLRKAVELDSHSALAHCYLGLALFKLEDYADADEQLLVAIRLSPRDTSLRVTRGRILEELQPDRVQVMLEGRIVESGGPELAERLDREGYEELR